MSRKFAMNRLFSEDKSFVRNLSKSECNELMCNIFQTFGNVYTYAKWLKHSSLFLALRGHTSELKVCHEWLFTRDKDGQKASVLCEFVNIFHTFGVIYTDVEWLNTSVVCF